MVRVIPLVRRAPAAEVPLSAKPRLACVTVNLPGLPFLCRHVGVSERSLPPAGVGAVARRAPERFADLFDRKGVSATFFVVGEDLEDGPSAMAIAELARLGHELASHGQTGDPDLASLAPAKLADEVRRGAEAIERLCGRRPAGFRNVTGEMTPELLAVLEDEGFLYDATIRPGPFAWLDRALAVRRRGGASTRLGGPAEVRAPHAPYRPNPRDPHRPGSAKLVELPTATVPLSRVPFTGRLAVSLPRRAVAAAYRALRMRDFVAVELHGWDLLDESDGASAALVERRRDLRVPVAAKRQRISELVDWLKHDFELLTLEEAAERLAPALR